MDEKWMKDELVALRSTVNVALQGSNQAQADIATVKQEMLHPSHKGNAMGWSKSGSI